MNYENILNFIQSRKSLYPAQMLEGTQISDEIIWKLLETANYAPSHKRTEPWRYVVFSDKSLVEFFDEMGNIYKNQTSKEDFDPKKIEKLQSKAKVLSHVIAICMKRDPNERIPECEEEYAVACSVQNMLLCMEPLNIIGYWGTGKIAFSKEMKKFLNLDDNDKCMGFLQLGVPKPNLPKIPKKQLSPIQEKVVWRK